MTDERAIKADTVLLIGTHEQFRDRVYRIAVGSRDLGGDPRRGSVTIDGVRYLAVRDLFGAQGFPRDSTAYQFIGHKPDNAMVDASMLCESRYATAAIPDRAALDTTEAT